MYPSLKMIKQWFMFWINDKDIKEWCNNKNLFFILSIGRTGTQFLSNLLNMAPRSLIVHEPVGSDFRAYQEAFHNESRAKKYIKHFRKKELYLRARSLDIDTYGEVNSVLRRHYKALKEEFPQAKFIHLIRDGKSVIRSMMSRKTMTINDKITKNIFPYEGDPWREKWSKMNRFERVCWYWYIENLYLMENIGKTIKFEDLISNYEYFRKNLLLPLNLEISYDRWQKEISVPKNITLEYKLPHWSDWNKKMKDSFTHICGEIMKANNYSLF